MHAIVTAIRVLRQEWIPLSVSGILALLSEFSSLLKFPSLAKISSEFVKRGLVAVLEEGFGNGYLARQDVVDRGLYPVMNNHLELNVHTAKTLVLFIIAEVIFTSLKTSVLLRGRGLATLSQKDRL